MTKRNVLLTSAGRRVALLRAFQQAAADIGSDARVLTADASPLSAAAWTASARHLVPRCTDPAFIPALRELCAAEGIVLIVPTIDTELPMLAQAEAGFARDGVMIAISAPETIAIGADKRRTHRWLREQGFPTVDQVDASQGHGFGHWPCIAKPARGSASVGIERLTSAAEIGRLDPSLDYVLQAVAPGHEYTVDVFVLDGRVTSGVVRRRLEVRAGEVSKAVTVRLPELEQLAASIVERLPGARGVLNVQVFVDEASGTMSVIEINPRFGGGYPLSQAAGVNYPLWLMQAAYGIAPEVHNRWRDHLVMLRYDEGVFIDGGLVGW